jgi:hypothetical protein
MWKELINYARYCHVRYKISYFLLWYILYTYVFYVLLSNCVVETGLAFSTSKIDSLSKFANASVLIIASKFSG